MALMHPKCDAGLRIVDFESVNTALWIGLGATVTLQDSSLSRNSISDTLPSNAVIDVYAVRLDASGAQQQDTILRLQECIISSGTGVISLIAFTAEPYTEFNASIYSDLKSDVYLFNDSPTQGTTLPTLPLAQAPARGINASFEWFLDVQQV